MVLNYFFQLFQIRKKNCVTSRCNLSTEVLFDTWPGIPQHFEDVLYKIIVVMNFNICVFRVL